MSDVDDEPCEISDHAVNELQNRSKDDVESRGTAPRVSVFLNPLSWSWAAIVYSVGYFVLMQYVLDGGLVSATESDAAWSIHGVIPKLFLPISIGGAIVCLVALALNAWSRRWTWFAAILFFSFFFASCFWEMAQESSRQRPPW